MRGELGRDSLFYNLRSVADGRCDGRWSMGLERPDRLTNDSVQEIGRANLANIHQEAVLTNSRVEELVVIFTEACVERGAR